MAAKDIPVIDISSLSVDTGERLVNAVHEWGFAFIKGDNTGFAAEAIGHIFELVIRHQYCSASWILLAFGVADTMANSRRFSFSRL